MRHARWLSSHKRLKKLENQAYLGLGEPEIAAGWIPVHSAGTFERTSLFFGITIIVVVIYKTEKVMSAISKKEKYILNLG